MAKGFKFEIVGFDEFEKRLNPGRFSQRMRKYIKQANEKNGLIGTSEIVRDIYAGKYSPNSRTTILLKGSSRPLVDTGTLAGSISYKVVKWYEVQVGVLRNRAVKSKRGFRTKGKARGMVNIAKALHFGANIPVTPKMRKLFYALSRKVEGVKPLRQNTKVIRIKPRPFLRAMFKDNVIEKYKENWEEAIMKALGK